MTGVRLVRAEASHVDLVAPLFDAYRQFYKHAPDRSLARRFIAERIERNESVIFLALGTDGEALGFTQLYPTFCSVEARPAFVLYDLYVVPEARRRGIARALMERARLHAEEKGAAWIGLNTAVTNVAAQPLYESLGYVRDTEFYAYFLPLKSSPISR